jgi:hypothetical protein
VAGLLLGGLLPRDLDSGCALLRALIDVCMGKPVLFCRDIVGLEVSNISKQTKRPSVMSIYAEYVYVRSSCAVVFGVPRRELYFDAYESSQYARRALVSVHSHGSGVVLYLFI